MPAKFEFRLQPLLDQRRRVEEEKQRNFASSRRAVEESVRELARLGNVRRNSLKQLVETALRRVTADLGERDAHLRWVEAALDEARRRRGEVEIACRRAREELIAASRERRVIEKLKERRLRAFETERARREEFELDDFNARRYDRALRERLTSRGAERAAR